MDYLNSVANNLDPCQNVKMLKFTFWDRSSSVWESLEDISKPDVLQCTVGIGEIVKSGVSTL